MFPVLRFTAAGYIEFLGPVGVDPSRDMGFMPYQTAANTAANAVGEHTAVVKFSNVIANKLYLMDCSVFEYFGGLTVFALAAGTSSAGAEQALTVSSDGHVLLGFESSSKSVAVSLRATGAPDTPVWILYGCNLHAVN